MCLGGTSSQTPPHHSLLGSFQRYSTKNLSLLFHLLLPPVLLLGLESQCSERGEGRGGAKIADASVLLSGVTVIAEPLKCCLEVGVQDGFSIWRLNVVGSFLKFQQHGHQRI